MYKTPVIISRVFTRSSAVPVLQIEIQIRLISTAKMTSGEPKWKIEKERILKLPLEEKRKLYKCNDYVNNLDPWSKYIARKMNKGFEPKKHTLDDVTEFQKIKLAGDNLLLREKVSLYTGDITKLEVDAIVNAANARLVAGGGVDGAIHRAAGPHLQEECLTLGGCPTGEAKITGGYNLPANYVIHTVGPQDGSASKLEMCYKNSLKYQEQYNLRTIAFPCISTGIYGFPNRLAAHIALRTARKFLEKNENMERIIFCTFLPIDLEIYETLMQMYLPMTDKTYCLNASLTE